MVLLATVLDLLDSLVTTIAGPSVVRDLRSDASLIQWLTAGYTIAMAAGILTAGRLGDIYGRKRCLLIGMAAFTAASLTCSLAQNPTELIIVRVLQGLFGALMVPQGFGLVKEMFPPAQAGKAMGAMGPAIAISQVGGPLLAGWLIDRDFFGLGWRMIFLINVPLGVLGVVLGIVALPATRRHTQLHLDLPGTLLAATAMGALIYPLIQGREAGWPWWTYVALALALLLFVAFVIVQRRRDQRGRATLVAPSLFAKKAFLGGLVVGLTIFAALIGLSIALTVFTQVGLRFSPMKAALAGLPQALGMIIGFGAAQVLASRGVAARAVIRAGMTVFLLALLGFGITINLDPGRTTIWEMAPALLFVGIGNGLTMASFFDLVLSVVDLPELGSASGALTAAQQVGASLGIALLGTVELTLLGPLTGTIPAQRYVHATQWATVAAAALVLTAGVATVALPKRSQNARPSTGHQENYQL